MLTALRRWIPRLKMATTMLATGEDIVCIQMRSSFLNLTKLTRSPQRIEPYHFRECLDICLKKDKCRLQDKNSWSRTAIQKYAYRNSGQSVNSFYGARRWYHLRHSDLFCAGHQMAISTTHRPLLKAMRAPFTEMI